MHAVNLSYGKSDAPALEAPLFLAFVKNGSPLTVAAAPACADTAHASRHRRTPQPRRAGVIAARAADVPRAKRILVADRLREKREGEKLIPPPMIPA